MTQIPRSVKGRARTRWTRYHSELVERGVWRESDAAILERLVLNLGEAETALAIAARTPTVIGSTGQMVAHPMYAVAARCDGVALSCARALTLTTLTREAHSGETDDDADTTTAEPDAFAALDELAERRERR